MKKLYILAICFCFVHSALVSTEFTISSYNCGGLSDHYDYLRAVGMQKLMQERHTVAPQLMAMNEKIQQVALKILFTKDPEEKALAQQEWDQKGYKILFNFISKLPGKRHSPNTSWNKKSLEMMTTYDVRPVLIFDEEVKQTLSDHISDLSPNQDLTEVRAIMAKRIFARYLKYDIICLQEADYLDPSMFPANYQVVLSSSAHSKNGVAWNKQRFEFLEEIGSIRDRAFVVLLKDKETDQAILVASGHLSGCNPYAKVVDPNTGIEDSAKGDSELQALIECLDQQEAEVKLIGMDSNVTSLHPRMNLLDQAGYKLDSQNYLEPTCTNPYHILNTRIDWIVLKSEQEDVSIVNIPVLNVGLNSPETNLSDHKPIAAKVAY